MLVLRPCSLLPTSFLLLHHLRTTMIRTEDRRMRPIVIPVGAAIRVVLEKPWCTGELVEVGDAVAVDEDVLIVDGTVCGVPSEVVAVGEIEEDVATLVNRGNKLDGTDVWVATAEAVKVKTFDDVLCDDVVLVGGVSKG